jgi:hypothetical protein
MSFVRWGEQNSDVYVYGGADFLRCCVCGVQDDGLDFKTLSYQEMIDHLKEHRRVGHVVPESAFKNLLDCMEEDGGDRYPGDGAEVLSEAEEVRLEEVKERVRGIVKRLLDAGRFEKMVGGQ